MKRWCLFVTADVTAAGISTKVASTHTTARGAQDAARRANRRGKSREVVSAEVMALMQEGKTFIEAVQAVAGKKIVPAQVEVDDD